MVSNRDAGTRVLKAFVDKPLVIHPQPYQFEDEEKKKILRSSRAYHPSSPSGLGSSNASL